MTNDKDSAVKDVIDRWYDSEVRQPAQSEGKINSNGKNERVSEVAASIRSALYRACPHMPRYPVGIVEPILAAFRQPTQSDALVIANERKAIAAWLRGEVATDYTDPEYDIGRNLADAIERGAYLQEQSK